MSKKVYAPDGRRLIFRVQIIGRNGYMHKTFAAGAYNVVDEHGTNLPALSDSILEEARVDGPHPTPCNDWGLRDFWDNCMDAREYLFGFRDMGQLTNWFMWPERMQEHVDKGEIGVYAVDISDPSDTVVDGQFQSIFHTGAAEQVAVLPLNTTYYNPETGEHHAN